MCATVGAVVVVVVDDAVVIVDWLRLLLLLWVLMMCAMSLILLSLVVLAGALQYTLSETRPGAWRRGMGRLDQPILNELAQVLCLANSLKASGSTRRSAEISERPACRWPVPRRERRPGRGRGMGVDNMFRMSPTTASS